jgi:quercetin dioxygenase-like cupin family protein
MEISHRSEQGPRLVLDVLGPTIEFLVSPSDSDAGYCVLKGTIPPGISVPLHSHPDEESFFLLSGKVHALEQRKNGFEWIKMNAGNFRHVPPGIKHAWKNESNEPAIAIIVTTPRLARFFLEVGKPVAPDTPSQHLSAADIQHFVDVASRYRHWLGTPEENAAVGIRLTS